VSGSAFALVDTGGASPVALLGDRHAFLLAGPRDGAERFAAHVARLGPLPAVDADALVALARESGLGGRGGGGFPVAVKLEAVRAAAEQRRRRPVVVVNGSESEPASRKDRTLLESRPHLVLDGAVLAARALRASRVVVHLHTGHPRSEATVRKAIVERAHGAGSGSEPEIGVSLAPARYVGGEASAVAASIEGGPALPRFSTEPLAVAGVHGRPTLVQNVETMAHLALLARHGVRRWRSSGASPWCGPALVTLAGAVSSPGLVVEVTGPVTIGALLRAVGGRRAAPAAVLVGGYAGTWLPGPCAGHLSVEPASLAAVGASFGCGVIGCLPSTACPLAETARLVTWLSEQGAGQCGPCVLGLPALARCMQSIGLGTATRGDRARLERLLALIEGRGACRHPDGIARLVRSALHAFGQDVDRHLRHRPCPGSSTPPVLPLPNDD
jgi:NADH:ubiquinone oxidoreductase subunit F (NADH-binding)